MKAGFFVTGTDTGVGKTVVACALVRTMRARKLDVGVMKPIETGVGEAGPLDARALIEAAGTGNEDPLELVCPLRFALPAAPNVAAAHECREVDLGQIRAAFDELSSRHDWMLVEGAGGILVPTTDDATMADLVKQLDLPVILVARPSLGTINHTRLSVEEIARRGLDLSGVVISHDRLLEEADARNLGCLRDWLGDRLVAEVPLLKDPSDGVISTRALQTLVERAEDLRGTDTPG